MNKHGYYGIITNRPKLTHEKETFLKGYRVKVIERRHYTSYNSTNTQMVYIFYYLINDEINEWEEFCRTTTKPNNLENFAKSKLKAIIKRRQKRYQELIQQAMSKDIESNTLNFIKDSLD